MATLADVWAILDRALEEIQALAVAAPEVILTGDPDAPLECPECGGRGQAWVEIDSDARPNDGESFTTSPTGADATVSINQGDQNYATLAYACGECDALVNFQSDSVFVNWG